MSFQEELIINLEHGMAKLGMPCGRVAYNCTIQVL